MPADARQASMTTVTEGDHRPTTFPAKTAPNADLALAARCAALTELAHISPASVFTQDTMPLSVIS
jgi:hypothetical protein